MTKKTEIVPKTGKHGASSPIEPEETVEVGQWYWHKCPSEEDPGRKYLKCVIHIGSNYAEVKGPRAHSGDRIHLDEFWGECERELDPEGVIKGFISRGQRKVAELMQEVRDITARLALTNNPGLQSGGEGAALARLDSSVSADAHKAALVKAKKTELPELFGRIKEENDRVSHWMTASLIPLRAQAKKMAGVVELIEGRIFNVELYAGLSEQVKLVRDGEAGGTAEKVHLMQRLCYMDEECLARYETGGMKFEDIKAFDGWLAKDENMKRLLPHEKCVTSFRVRRHQREIHYEGGSISSFVQMVMEAEDDKATFLYIRNGDRLYRMSTSLDFGVKLFPDMDARHRGTEKLWAKTFVGLTKDDLITEGAYLEIKREDIEKEKERKKLYKQATKDEKYKYQFPHHSTYHEYVPFDQSSILYDDIAKREADRMEKHNRIALILQGLLDRSEVFHPHPDWKIWDPGGFEQALVLEYDESRALTTGDPPSFEAYREELNRSIKAGTATVGQDGVWARHEAEKQRKRDERNWRRQDRQYFPTEVRPYGNPGPGNIALVAQATKTGKLTYKWTKKRANDWREREPRIQCSIEMSSKAVLNVDAYKPGDFRKFFDDPRTRANYLKWAPLLLEAEEYKAGNRKVGPDKD